MRNGPAPSDHLEATQISPEGQGYISTPGITVPSNRRLANLNQSRGVVARCMVRQVGRICHPSFQPGGASKVAPSAIKPNAAPSRKRVMLTNRS
jgi:N-ethylmaleimide reductase